MARCKKCGAKLVEGAKYCSRCGTPVVKRPKKGIKSIYVITIVVIVIVCLVAWYYVMPPIEWKVAEEEEQLQTSNELPEFFYTIKI